MRSVLLLNASWEPLRIIPLTRAVVLVMQEKADVIEVGEEPVRSTYLNFPAPAVIRLRYFVKIPWHAKVALNRKNLQIRDGHDCQVVGCTRKGNTIDHIRPRSKGGAHRWDNVTLMCSTCNQAKGNRTLDELGWRLKTQPSVPRGGHIIVGVSFDPLWAPHLAHAAG